MSNKIRTIIPELISLESSLDEIKGSYFFRRLNFFPDAAKPLSYHYKVTLGKVDVPNSYSFRHGYYTYNEGCWYYKRSLGPVLLAMKYDPKPKHFFFSNSFKNVSLDVGSIFPMGKHIADMMHLELMLKGYVVMRGFAYRKSDEIKVIVLPSFNGKSTRLALEMLDGAEYIAEDILVMDLKRELIFPTAALHSNYGRDINSKLVKLATNNKVMTAQKVTQIDFAYTAAKGDAATAKLVFKDYVLLNSLLFMDNYFMRAYIFVNNLADKIVNQFKDPQTKIAFRFEDADKAGKINKDHWDALGEGYGRAWDSPAKEVMSKNELRFLHKAGTHTDIKEILDIGVGTGRILQRHLEVFPKASFYGVDIAPKMIEHCTDKFAANSSVKKLEVCDISKEPIPFDIKFDYISAVRVLKYNKNWREMVDKLGRSLKPGGILVFSMTNYNSINRFGRYHIPFERTTPAELNRLTSDLGLESVDMAAFTKIPDALYHASTNKLYNHALVFSEKALQLVFGKVHLGRELFVAVRRAR